MKIKISPWGFGSSCWVWHIVNNRNEIIATSCQNYSSRKKAIRAARYYAKKFTLGIFELGIKNEHYNSSA